MAKPVLVCATDLEPDGDRAVDFAAALARAIDAHVVLLHATDALDEGTDAPRSIAPALDALRERVRARRDEAEVALGAEAARVSASGASVEAKLVDGPPWRAIVDTATALHATAIVVGRRNRPDWLAGPTVDRVMRHAPCPTLVVPPADAARR